MNTTVRLLLTMIALLSMVNHASADSAREERAEVVLEVGKIDSSTVSVGALAVAVYGKGKRHPVSGAWTKLDTARGYVKAIDRQQLILALKPDGWPNWTQRIDLERIQTLILVESPSPSVANRDSTQVTSSRAECRLTESSNRLSVRTARVDDIKTSERISLKLRNGVIASGIFQLGGIALLGIDSIAGPFPGAVIGSAVGAVVGVLRVDPPSQSRNSQKLFMALAGSWIGTMVAGLVTSRDTYYGLPTALALSVCPAVGATLATELWRKPIPAEIKSKPEASRFSIGLVPTPKRGLSAVATLRF